MLLRGREDRPYYGQMNEMGFAEALAAVVACIAITSAIVFTIRKAAPRPKGLPVTAGWIEGLTLTRYRPMLRLLDPEDLQIVRSHPGYTPAMLAKLRRQRCHIFRGYLRSLQEDFARVCLALKLVMAQAGTDRRDLAAILIRSQVQFAAGMALVHVRLALYGLGFGTVDARQLLRIFDGVRVELRTLMPAAAEQ